MHRILLLALFMPGLYACATNPYESATAEAAAGFLKVHVPFPPQTQFYISQGAFGRQSHDEIGNEFSWDFDVPYGTTVTAVREGTVLEVWEPRQKGGCDPKFSSLAHNVKIQHPDGTVAQYVHIQSVVKKGDQVRAGQKIAETAENGWICRPQLHFGIYKSSNQLYESPRRQTVPVYFIEIPGGIARQGRHF
jgi:murein DD-endopeptidase MepM/ murein hydrolase activator NlpD